MRSNLRKRLEKEIKLAFEIKRGRFTKEEEELLKEVASYIVLNRLLSTPAIMLLEASQPLNYLLSQFMHVASPFAGFFSRRSSTNRFAGRANPKQNRSSSLANLIPLLIARFPKLATLMENRRAMERLAELIVEKTNQKHSGNKNGERSS